MKPAVKPQLPPDPPGPPPPPRPAGLGATLALVGLTIVILHALPSDAVNAQPLILLLAVLVAALAFGFYCGLLAAFVAFAALNFLFTEPLYTFRISRPEDLATLVVFLAVAALAGLLAGRLHDRAEAARARAETLAVLAASSSDLAAAFTEPAALQATLGHLARLAGSAVALTLHDGRPVPRPPAPDLTAPDLTAPDLTDADLTDADLAAAERALRLGRPEPAPLPGWPGARLSFVPVGATLVLGHPRLTGPEASRRAMAIAALADQLRLTLQRLAFAETARTEARRAEAEATRSAVLTSLGHDLRTPLATILGAASSLRELDATLDGPARADLIAAIEEEAGRLNLHVANLLQMGRLERAAPPRRAWVDLNDIAGAAAARARRAFAGAEIRLEPADLPMLRSEGGLVEQALFNLIDNALHHGAAPVGLSTGRGAEGLCVTIRDAGPGLSPALQDWLAGPDLHPAPGQRGLGLAVAKGIAHHLGGRLSWQDGAFRLTLPEAP